MQIVQNRTRDALGAKPPKRQMQAKHFNGSQVPPRIAFPPHQTLCATAAQPPQRSLIKIAFSPHTTQRSVMPHRWDVRNFT